MLQVGLIGSGFIAKAHAEAYSNIDNATIAAVASKTDPSEFVAEYASNAETFSDTETLLEEIDPDIVDVCVPTFVHPDVVETAVSNGYDTLCEKPIAPTLSESEEMAELVAENDVQFMVGHTVRFAPPYREAKRLVDDDDIGDPAVIRTSRIGGFPDWGWNNWFADPAKSGGIHLDLMIHDFDYLRWAFGEVQRVFTRDVRWGEDDELLEHAVTTLRFESGAVAHVEGSWAQPDTREFTYSFEVAGNDGLIEFDGNTDAYHRYTQEEGTTSAPSGPTAMQLEIEAFLDSIQAETEPPVTVDDAIEALRISTAAIQSAERGEPVWVAEVEVTA